MPTNRFARSVSVLAGGTVMGQIIVVAASPLLTRLYTPEGFGLLAVFASIISILSVIASLRYQLAIPLPESEREAANIVALSLLMVLATSAISALGAFIFREPLATLLNTPELAHYIGLIPLALMLVGIYQVFNYWAIRIKAFPAIAQTKIMQAGWMTTIQIAGFMLGPVSLLLGRIIGQGAGTLTLLKQAKKHQHFDITNITTNGVSTAAKRYKNFPIYSSWAGLLNAGGAQVPPIFFAAFFGPAAAGAYMLAQRVINLPMTVVATAVANAFLPNAVEAHRANHLGRDTQKLFRTLAILVLPPAAVLFVIAPDLFALVFGSEWREAGEMVRWLAPMLAIQFQISPLSRIFIALERQRLGLTLQGALFLLRANALICAYTLSFSSIEAVQLFSALSIVGYLFYYIAIIKITGSYFLQALATIPIPATLSVSLAGTSYLILQLDLSIATSIAFVFTMSLTSAALYWKKTLGFPK